MKPGFYTDMPAEEYHATPALSKSGMAQLDRSAAHYKVPVISTRPMMIGSACHTATLEPEKFEEEYVILPKGRRRSGTHDVDGRLILNHTEGSNLPGMVEAVRNHEDAGPLLSYGQAEMSVFWEDPTYGFLCKARPDWTTDNKIMVDLKKCQDAREWPFAKSFFNLKYDWQAYWYLNGAEEASEQATGERVEHKDFAFIAVEEQPPHGVNVFFASKETLVVAMEEIEPIKAKYAECLKSGKWPRYESGPKYIELPNWKRA